MDLKNLAQNVCKLHLEIVLKLLERQDVKRVQISHNASNVKMLLQLSIQLFAYLQLLVKKDSINVQNAIFQVPFVLNVLILHMFKME